MSNWDKIRKEVLKRDGYRCQKCGGRKKLNVHHKKPRSEGGTDNLFNLITLCKGCHIKLHQLELKKESAPMRQAVLDRERCFQAFIKLGGDIYDLESWYSFVEGWR